MTTQRTASGRGPVLVLVLLTAVALGVAATVATVSPTKPGALRAPAPTTTFPVERRADDDQREVQLALATGGPRTIVAPRAGMLTSMTCASGETVESGSVIARIDGNDVIALGSDEPLWRDLRVGDTGPDVRSLQRELSRIGFSVAVDGTLGPRTIAGVQRLLRTVGSPIRLGDSVPVDMFAWVPGGSVPIQVCNGVVGTTIEPNAPLMTLPVDLVSAAVTPVPDDAAPGPREIRIGSVRLAINEDGRVTEVADLRKVASTREYAEAAADGGESSIAAEWRLAEPDEVFVVPPTALYDIRGTSGCLQEPGTREPRRVEIVGSDLGQSFVRADEGAEIRRVRVQPNAMRSCR